MQGLNELISDRTIPPRPPRPPAARTAPTRHTHTVTIQLRVFQNMGVFRARVLAAVSAGFALQSLKLCGLTGLVLLAGLLGLVPAGAACIKALLPATHAKSMNEGQLTTVLLLLQIERRPVEVAACAQQDGLAHCSCLCECRMSQSPLWHAIPQA